MRPLIAIVLLLLAGQTEAQQLGGHVLDVLGLPVRQATILLTQSGVIKGKTLTDNTGTYSLEQLSAGSYNLLVTGNGYDSALVKQVTIGSEPGTQNILLVRAKGSPRCMVTNYRKPLEFTATYTVPPYTSNNATAPKERIPAYCRPPLSLGGARPNVTQYYIDGVLYDSAKLAKHVDRIQEDLRCIQTCTYMAKSQALNMWRLPTTDVRDIASLEPLMYQARRGDDISTGGSRTSGVGYIVDGTRILDAQPEHRTPYGR